MIHKWIFTICSEKCVLVPGQGKSFRLTAKTFGSVEHWGRVQQSGSWSILTDVSTEQDECTLFFIHSETSIPVRRRPVLPLPYDIGIGERVRRQRRLPDNFQTTLDE